MTAIYLYQLSCESEAAADCRSVFPAAPIQLASCGGAGSPVEVLRGMAGGNGWRTGRRGHGEDVCPPCRMLELEQKAKARQEARV